MVRKSTNFTERKIWNTKGSLKEGDELEGYYVAHRNINTKFGPAEVFDIDAKDGQAYTIMGSAGIRHKMLTVPTSAYVWVKYNGKVETDNGSMNDYTIDYDDEK